MSDQRLRETERRYRSTGDPQDEAAWLAERLRVEPGLQVRLAAAACAGHAPACAALGVEPAPATPLLSWIVALQRHGQAPLVAATAAALRPIVAGAERGHVGDRDTRQALAAAAAWLAEPSPRTEELCAETGIAAGMMAWRLAQDVRDVGRKGATIHERCLLLRLAVEADGASCVAFLVATRGRQAPDPVRTAAQALSCAAVVARGTEKVLRRAEETRALLGQHERDGTPLFDADRDAAVLDRARRGVAEWAVGPLTPVMTPDVRALSERLLDGQLPASLVIVAARAGHPAARSALGVDAPPIEADVRALVEGLARLGREVHVRAGLGALKGLVATDPGAVTAAFLQAVRAWLTCPCAACAAVVEQAASDSESRAATLLAGCLGARDDVGATRYALATVRWCVLQQATLAAGVTHERCRDLEASLLPGAKRAADPALLEALGVASLDELFTADGAVQAAVRAALVEWALRDTRPPA